jgi:putative ABC transport system permease protein
VARTLLLRLRWSWRDLRSRWLQVAAIALVIGIGSGLYSGLSSVSEWRRSSYPASYEALAMYDLRADFADGVYLDAGALAEAASSGAAAPFVEVAEARLLVDVQVDASTPAETVLVPGRIVGVDTRDGGPRVSAVGVYEGRALTGADAGEPVAVLEEGFADEHGIEPGATITVLGDRSLEVVGRGASPEQFFVLTDRGGFFTDFAYAYVPLATAQDLAGRAGQANDLVVRLRPGVDAAAAERAVAGALAAAFPDAGFELVAQQDDPVLRLLFDDIEGDQRFYDVFAVVILAGAAFAAFNLVGRVVESQRREIGIAMALGVMPRQIALRPLLFAAQVALAGVVFGVGVGALVGAGMSGVLESFFPLPVWRTDFQPAVFARGAVLGLLLPFAASLLPVWRAVRVTPVEAVRSNRTAGSGMVGVLRRVPLPGRSVSEMPIRNVLRAPRRTALTALGIGAAIATLVGVLGMVDSMLATVDASDAEIGGGAPDRLTVGLDFFYPIDGPEVGGVVDAPGVGAAEPTLTVGATLDPAGEDIDVLLTAVDFGSEIWHPTAKEGRLRRDVPGLVLAEKAAADVGVGVGDTVVLRHPLREGVGATLVESELPVVALHPNPFRAFAFVDVGQTGFMNLEGIANSLDVVPAPGVSVEEVQRELFGRPAVATVEPVEAAADALRDQLEEFLSFFAILQAGVLLLALLIAFNSTAINMDERAREHATMFAFGLPVRSVLRISVTESLLTGLLGTVAGLVAGRLLLAWLVNVLLPETLPDLGIIASISAETIATTLLLGVVAVAIAPVFTVRRLRRMDIPSTLRVME